jgi:hypothetical protein
MKPTKQHHPDTPKTKTTPYDTATNLDADVRITAPQEAVLIEGRPQVIASAVDANGRAKAKASLQESQRLAQKTGLSQITDEEINEEIRLVRAARREVK